ncbi:DUF1680-domain-containing protein [Didymella exigua CBS 183.55]|uniref:DUF1680-domain-containing protein n=1 Tax=Didymella exigua CBS 183.55 TaxID=1150837 RepID=A0A6A5RZ01_9PLEO|nr:DUF1680-domain-containing protein [Didymella exigua CBS 183.55]KAF1930477.1 DUF1680-domain-containing protein [Didymella exigua CBS 183.55]
MRFLSILGGSLVLSPTLAQVAPVVSPIGVSASYFDIDEVSLTSSRFMDNQNRTLSYLKAINLDRMLYVFRSTHKLSTNGAAPNGGWDAPNFSFRSHVQGHFLSAWAQCYAQLKDTTCRTRATSFVAELLKCQNNNAAAGFSAGYVSGFPESEFDKLESGTLSNGNVPYYAIHKTLAGLLDVYRWIGDQNAKTVLLAFAGWVDQRTSKLTTDQMQKILQTEFGGMNEVMADIYHQTGEKKWLKVAQRFDHAAVFDPLASNEDQLNGLHANTQVPKWIGAAREYKATGTSRYADIARNAWALTVNAHTYAIGANSQAEHFRAPNAIAAYLNHDAAEGCNTYNMLKLTRELFVIDPNNAKYFDFYEQALINHMLGQQDPSQAHGHITYFTSLNPGGKRGVGPALGGGTWSTDYDSHWCCQGTGLETNTKMQDSIYFYDISNIYINLFIPSAVNWKAKSVSVSQSTTFPAGDTTTLTVTGSGNWAMKIRIPGWTKGASIAVNGATQSITANPGTYATLSRTWKSGDTVTIKLPMSLRVIPANDNKNIGALAYGPSILSGNYGTSTLSANPKLDLGSVKRTGSTGLSFTGTADGTAINIGPFYDAQGFNYVVYWATSGSLPSKTL